MRIIIRPIGEAGDMDVTEWLVAAIAGQLERCGDGGGGAGDAGSNEGGSASECSRKGERNRRAARRHLRLVIESFRELAAENTAQTRLGVAEGDGHEVGSIFAFDDLLGDGRRRLGGADGVAITDNAGRTPIRMAPKLTGADGRGRVLGGVSGVDGLDGGERAGGGRAVTP